MIKVMDGYLFERGLRRVPEVFGTAALKLGHYVLRDSINPISPSSFPPSRNTDVLSLHGDGHRPIAAVQPYTEIDRC